MKKTLILICALVAMPMFYANVSAQDDEGRLIVAGSSDSKASLEIGTHMGFGYNFIKSNDFTPSRGGEFFINIIKARLFPVEGFGLELGIDYKTVSALSKEDAFYKDNDNKALAMPYSQKYPGEISKNFSRLRTNTFSLPVLLKFEAGDFHLGFGAEGNLNLGGRIKDKFIKDGKKNKFVDKGVQFNRYTYNFLAVASYDGTGVYFKYYPKSSKLTPEGSVDFELMTVGVIFDF